MDGREGGHGRPRNRKELALGELEPAAGALLAVLLPLVHPSVATQVPQFFKLTAQFGVEFQESAGNTEPRRAGLPRKPAAIGEDQDVKLVRRLGSEQRPTNRAAGCWLFIKENICPRFP